MGGGRLPSWEDGTWRDAQFMKRIFRGSQGSSVLCKQTATKITSFSAGVIFFLRINAADNASLNKKGGNI